MILVRILKCLRSTLGHGCPNVQKYQDEAELLKRAYLKEVSVFLKHISTKKLKLATVSQSVASQSCLLGEGTEHSTSSC